MNNATIENGVLFLQNAANETFSQYIPANPTDSNDTVAATLGFLSNSTQAYYAANLASSPDQALINTTYAEVIDAVAQYALAVWNSIMDTYGFVPSEDALASTTDNVTIENFATVQTQAALNTASLIVSFFTHVVNPSNANRDTFYLVRLLLRRHRVHPHPHWLPRHNQRPQLHRMVVGPIRNAHPVRSRHGPSLPPQQRRRHFRPQHLVHRLASANRGDGCARRYVP